MKIHFTACIAWIVTIAVTSATHSISSAAPIATYQIPQTGSNYTSIPPNGVAAGIAASPLAATNTVAPNTFGNHFYFRYWNSTFNLTKYYENTLTVAPGKILHLTDVSYSVEATGPGSKFAIRSSLDGFTSNIDLFTANGVAVTNRTSSLTSLGPITGSVSFRFYATAPNPGARMGFANHLPGAAGAGSEIPGRHIRFSGLVVPEPSTGLLMALAFSLTLLPRKSSL